MSPALVVVLDAASKQRWNAFLEGEAILSKARDPEHEACRELQARGFTGKVSFVLAGVVGLTMDIAAGAGLTTSEGEMQGPRVGAYAPFPVGMFREVLP